MSKILSLIIMILVVVFSVSNKTPSLVSLWPLPYDVESPLVFIILIVFFLGFSVGCFTNWVSHFFHRKESND
ncbi:MAG: hypothetical protein B7Y25_02265 [Alphaproteobacteria bacterium 16-39-46]|nr:MAG: hypothetical protein B7Y25_02265 [Alphaproteobacteria bacterium 16-39-46]OZA43663.1 MAG: hypothetical protein B7X84_02485 [Alphaproteobacteria bacterium 17-39-52]HQS83738.1 LapA family protein [Alphaproteobacteria bacterium]HQS93503.1 LapA family protein [Alphaproteobacteria bacterium]